MSVGQRRRRRAAVLIFAVAGVVALVFLLNGLAVIRQMRDLEEQWREQTSIAQVRAAQLFRLQNALGYGGFIDNFKNFILQGDLGALDAAKAHLDLAKEELEGLAAGGLGETHPEQIERLRFVIKAYQVRIVMADDAFSDGYSSNEIANLVTVEDQPALDALRALSDEIDAAMAIVQRETRKRLEDAVGLATLGLLILPLIAVVAWLLVRFLRDMTSANDRANLAATRVEAIIAASPEAMIVIDAVGKIVRANTAAGRLLGYEPARLVGMPASTLTPPDPASENGDALAQLIGDNGSPVVVGRETWIAKRSGDRVPVDISASVTGDGADALVTMLIRDATLRRNYEQGLIEARQAAERASNAKSEFLANVSHEVRTPINAIIGLSGLLQKTPLSDQQSDYVSKLHSAGRRLLDLVNDMLDFARIDAGRMEIELSPFDPRELIDQVATVAAVHAESKNLELIFRVSRSVPTLAIGDENRLGQVLSNLVSNAIKFTNEGSVIIEADAEALLKDSVVLRFAVRDTGIGIPATQLDQLFEAFTQADSSATRKHGGAGLGLAICQSLVEAMGGVISAESRVGEGSVFRFSVTAQVPAEAAARQPRTPASIDPTALPVLVVDDNDALRSVLQEELSALGFPVTALAGGSLALEAVIADGDEPAYPLMLVDWQMPDMDGIELIRQVSERFGIDAMPVTILITAFDGKEAREAAASLPVDAFLEKPVNTSTLIDSLMDAMVSRRRGDAGDIRRRESAARIAAIDRVAPGHSLMAHADGARVLIVDDNSINQQVARELLAEIGAVSELADSGQQAIDMLTAFPADYFDLVLMDIQMPGMDGISTTEKLRADSRFDKLPIVALTAHALGEERDRCFRAGMDGHISKPVAIQQLTETLNAWVGAERSGGEAAFETEQEGETRNGAAFGSRDVEAMPLFDPGRVATLKNLSDGFLEQMLRDFSSRYHGAAAEIRSLLDQRDFERAQKLAHTIKGTSGSLGAERLFGVSRQLDDALRNPGDGEHIDRLAGAFEEVLSLTLNSIEQDYGAN